MCVWIIVPLVSCAGFPLYQPLGEHTTAASASQGMRVTVVRALTEDWCLVALPDGRGEGVLPMSHLAVPGTAVRGGGVPVTPSSGSTPSPTNAVSRAGGGGGAEEDAGERGVSTANAITATSVAYTAIAAYVGRSERELSLANDEQVLLVQRLSADWFQVQNTTGAVGTSAYRRVVSSRHMFPQPPPLSVRLRCGAQSVDVGRGISLPIQCTSGVPQRVGNQYVSVSVCVCVCVCVYCVCAMAGLAPASYLKRVYEQDFYMAIAAFDGPGIRVSLTPVRRSQCMHVAYAL